MRADGSLFRAAAALFLLLVVRTLAIDVAQLTSQIKLSGVRNYVGAVEHLLNVWSLANPGVSGTFLAVAAANVRTQLYDGVVDAAITDLPPSAAEKLKTDDLAIYPLFAQPVLPVYNIPEVKGMHLVFSGNVIARIIMGNMTHWNDPEFQALNPDVELPNVPISAVVLAQGREVAIIDAMSMYLSEVNEEWRQRIGNVKYLVWKTVNPNVNYLTPNNPSLTRKKFLETPYCFGMHWMETTKYGVEYGYMLNKAGVVVAPTVSAVQYAMLETGSQGVTFDYQSLNSMDTNARDAYPIVLWSYALMRKDAYRDTCAVKAATVNFFKWLIESDVARDVAAEESLAILPDLLK